MEHPVFWDTQYFGTPSIVEIKRHTLPPGLSSVNFIIDLEKLKPSKNYNKLQSNDKRKIIENEEVSLNCIDTINDNEGIFLLFYSDKVAFSLKQFEIGKNLKSKIINLFTLAEKNR